MPDTKPPPLVFLLASFLWCSAALLGVAHAVTVIYLGHSFILWNFYGLEDMVAWTWFDRFYWLLIYGLGTVGGAWVGLSLLNRLIDK